MAYRKVAGLAMEVEVVPYRNMVFQDVTVHTAHHGLTAVVVQQTRNWKGFEELLHHLDCLLAQASDWLLEYSPHQTV